MLAGIAPELIALLLAPQTDRIQVALKSMPPAMRQACADIFAAQIEAPSDCALAERLGLARALHWLGDPRLRPKDPEMVRVPAGNTTIGTETATLSELLAGWRLARNGQGVPEDWLAPETPAFALHLPAFAIGRYPVTNLEYQVFCEDTGYPPPPGWPPAAACLQHPVAGVPLAGAAAYCEWLAVETGRHFRLPTEFEWEKAARGPQGSTYPWGDPFEFLRCNSWELGHGGTTPVGIFPEGASSCGALDMSGNVHEWTLSHLAPYAGYSLPYRWVETAAVLRGGAFDSFRDEVRCARRRAADVDPRACGFRVLEELPTAVKATAADRQTFDTTAAARAPN